MADYRNLKITDKARCLIRETYRLTGLLPAAERHGLGSQMRRAAVSIGSNIAEGSGRSSDVEFRRYLRIARGSAHELEFQARLASDLALLPPDECEALTTSAAELIRMLAALIQTLSRPPRS